MLAVHSRFCEGELVDGSRCRKRAGFGLLSLQEEGGKLPYKPSTHYISLKALTTCTLQACCCNKKKTKCNELRAQHDAKRQVLIAKGEANKDCAIAMLFGCGLGLDADTVRGAGPTVPHTVSRWADSP